MLPLEYAVHILCFNHSCTQHQTLSVSHDNHTKARHPPERKRKQEVSHHAHGSLFKKKKRKEGKMTMYIGIGMYMTGFQQKYMWYVEQ